jgi:hypothetical protein
MMMLQAAADLFLLCCDVGTTCSSRRATTAARHSQNFQLCQQRLEKAVHADATETLASTIMRPDSCTSFLKA